MSNVFTFQARGRRSCPHMRQILRLAKQVIIIRPEILEQYMATISAMACYFTVEYRRNIADVITTAEFQHLPGDQPRRPFGNLVEVVRISRLIRNGRQYPLSDELV